MEGPEAIAAWDDLARQAADPNPFFESWFLLPALRSFDPAGTVTILCLEVDGVLAGLMPVQRAARYYGRALPHWRMWMHANAFLGAPLALPGFDVALWHMALSWLDRQGGGLFFHCPHLPVHGPAGDALRTALDERDRPHAVVLREERAMLHSMLSPEAYLEQALTGKKRKELRRQHRRLAEHGALTTERATDAAGLEGWVAEFLALEQAGWKGQAGSALASADGTAALFAQALSGAAARGRLERLAIRIDGQPLAMLASFRCDQAAFSFKTTYDENFARYSPGVLLQCENLAMLGQPGFRWADSCAAADHPMIDHIWRERRAIASVNLALGGAARRMVFRALAAWETRGARATGGAIFA